MAQRTFWKGYLKLSLVTCPVAMSPATSEADKIRFHTLNRETGHRVDAVYLDAATGKPVRDEDEVKGYPTGEDSFVILEDDEIASVALESTHTIDIQTFVPRESIAWIWQDQPHYMIPDDTVGEEAFSVIREAMARTDTVGISRLVLYRRERAVMLVPRGRGIVLWTLRYGDEVRDEAAYASGEAKDKADPDMMRMMEELIDRRTRRWSPDMASDPVQAGLADLIASRTHGRKPPKAKAPPKPPGNVVDIMSALRASVAAETTKSGRKGR